MVDMACIPTWGLTPPNPQLLTHPPTGHWPLLWPRPHCFLVVTGSGSWCHTLTHVSISSPIPFRDLVVTNRAVTAEGMRQDVEEGRRSLEHFRTDILAYQQQLADITAIAPVQ